MTKRQIFPLFLLSVMLIALFVPACKKKPDVPTITVITPEYGPEETLVTIEGENLAEISQVRFSGQPINFNTAYNSDVALLFRVPDNVPVGPHVVELVTKGGIAVTNFRITLDPPQVFSVVPEFASPGEVVSIYGRNFYDPVSVFFHDSVASEIVFKSTDSLRVKVPVGATKGKITVVANGGDTLSPSPFFSRRLILVNDFDGNGTRKETNKWVFVGSVQQNAGNAVQNTNPAPLSGNFLKLTGKDDLNISWIGGAQNHFGFPGDMFSNFGIESTNENTLLQVDLNSNGKTKTHILVILLENGGSNNDFTYKLAVDWNGWKQVSIPLTRFTDLNGLPVNPAKVKVVKFHLIDELDSNSLLEVNVDNVKFLEDK
jgi:hypothetical protein